MANELISFGAGVNSAAMTILLVNEGWRGPIVYADTGCDWPETTCWISYFEREWLNPRGLAVTTLGADYRGLVPGRDKRTLVEFCEGYRLTPFPGTRWCTVGWKTDVIDQWAKEHGIERQLIAMAIDERHRQKGRACPLIDRGITRKGCLEIIRQNGLQAPQKSSCYICPFQTLGQFAELRHRHPELYERAANLERLSAERRGERCTLRLDGMTLDEFAAFLDARGPSWINDEEMDGLLEYKPCVCGL
jgi:hypothetical protein